MYVRILEECFISWSDIHNVGMNVLDREISNNYVSKSSVINQLELVMTKLTFVPEPVSFS